MDNLPDEIMEIIFMNLSPYKQYNNAACVCQRWKRIIDGLFQQNPQKFEHKCKVGNIEWYEVDFGSQITNVTPRIGQSMCYNDHTRSVYIFGGRSLNNAHTGFNDLLRLDMDTLTWHRPLIKGDFMAPKFGCAFQSYKNYLLIFGGSSLPPTNTLGRGRAEFNNDLHIYDTTTGILTHKSFLQQECPPELYLPTTCVIQDDLDPENDIMVVYGGRKMASQNFNNKELWCLNLHMHTWEKQVLIGDPIPQSFNETSKGIMVKFDHSSYSSAILVLSHSPKIGKGWLLLKTGYAEWTWQLLSFAAEEQSFGPCFQSMFNFNDIPYISVGKTLVLFSLFYDTKHMPSLDEARPFKTVNSQVDNVKPSSVNSKICNGKTVPQTTTNSENSPLYMYMLDLSNIERNGELKWVDQMNSNILMSNFLVNNVPRRLKVVLGRNEIILLGSEKNMPMYFVRGKNI